MKTITSIREVGNELINPIVTNSKHSSLSIAPTETQTMRQFLQESLVARSSTVGGQGSNKTKSFFLTVYLFVFVSPVTKWKNTRSTPALFDNSPLRCKSSDSTRSGYRAHSNCRVQTGFIRLVDEKATRRPLPDKRQSETCANRTLQRERGKSPTGGASRIDAARVQKIWTSCIRSSWFGFLALFFLPRMWWILDGEVSAAAHVWVTCCKID